MSARPGLLASLCLALSASPASAATPNLAETIERFDHLRVGDAVAVTNLRLGEEHFECILRSGSAAPVKAGEEVVGLFLEGDGTMDYLSVEPIEAPVVAFVA